MVWYAKENIKQSNYSTFIFWVCQEWDSSTPGFIMNVKIDTHQDLEISWMQRPKVIETETFLGSVPV